jgi:hypothetical protein
MATERPTFIVFDRQRETGVVDGYARILDADGIADRLHAPIRTRTVRIDRQGFDSDGDWPTESTRMPTRQLTQDGTAQRNLS